MALGGMAHIIGIAGSLRQGSYNAALLREAAMLAPVEAVIEIASIREFVPYDGDIETVGIPEVVSTLKDKIAAADGLLLVTPEYNNSLPGVLKNAIDWLTRPDADIKRVFWNKPVGVIGASDGQIGTKLAQTAWLPVFRTLRMRPYFGHALYVAFAQNVFDASGKMVGDKVRKQLTEYMAGFVEFVDESRTGEK